MFFALVIGGSWVNECVGGVFVVGLVFILINLIMGNFFGVKLEMLSDLVVYVSIIFVGEILVVYYFVNIFG